MKNQTSIHNTSYFSETSLLHPTGLADYLDAIQQPETIRDVCGDYRATAAIDLLHDRESRAEQKRICCLEQVSLGGKGNVER